MSPKQLDIFGAGTQKKEKRTARPRKRREAKKAPMLLDAYVPGEGQDAPCAVRRAPCVNHGLPITNHQSPITSPESRVPSPESRIYSISEITENIKTHLEGSFTDIWVSGEVTDFRNRTGRHYYFALKDDKSKMRAVIFGAEGRDLKFDLVDGLEVICHGRLNVYAPQGSYSLLIDHIEPKGKGALQLAFEQLKKKLETEGLFARERKRPLPYLPRRIGVVTSPTGAAIRDIVHVLTRRFPNIEILLNPVRVQGEGAAAEIAEAIGRMNSIGGFDVLIVGRGGGSIEDLWAFNEEIVARAIASSNIPVISAVGHEIDFTIADFVADARAATPSAAAEIAVPVRDELILNVRDRKGKLALALKQLVNNRAQGLSGLVARLGDPRRRMPDLMIRVDGLRERLAHAAGVAMERQGQRFAALAGELSHLSPLGVLAKGYAVVQDSRGNAVRQASSLKMGDELGIRFYKGSARAKVTKVVDG